MESNKSELDSLITNLCIVVHTELDTIGSEINLESKSISEIMNMESFEALEYISNAIELAMAAKKTASERSYYEEFLTNETYQKEMQKHEHTIRNHIKIEQQMKLYADALEEKNDLLEKSRKELKKESNTKIEKRKLEKMALKRNISRIKKDLEDLKKGNDPSGRRSGLKISMKERGQSSEINKKVAKVDREYSQLSKSIADFEHEYLQQKKDNEELKRILKEYLSSGDENKEQELAYKAKYEKKCIELESVKKKIRQLELLGGNKNTNRSITPTITKNTNTQSSRTIRKVSSTDKIKSQRLEKIVQKSDRDPIIEKKRLPLNFTARR